MTLFKGNGEPGGDSVLTTLDSGERELFLDDAFLYAAQHAGIEVNLDRKPCLRFGLYTEPLM